MTDPTKQKQRGNAGFILIAVAIIGCFYGYNYLKTQGTDITGFLNSALSSAPKQDPALLEARLSDAEIVAFTKEAAGALRLDAENYQQQLQAMRPYFTREGFEDFIEGLQRARMMDGPGRTYWLENIEMPVVTRQEPVNGVYRWDVQFPARQRNSATLSSDMVFKLAIVRSEEPENKQGVGIARWIVIPR